MTSFTMGGHGFGTEEGLSHAGAPMHAGQDEGATLHSGGSAQYPENSAAAGEGMDERGGGKPHSRGPEGAFL